MSKKLTPEKMLLRVIRVAQILIKAEEEKTAVISVVDKESKQPIKNNGYPTHH